MKTSRTFQLLATILAGVILAGCGRNEADAPPAAIPAVAVAPTNQPTPPGAENLAFAKLQGKWLRPDGGYTLEIRSAAPDGKLEAAYFNPRPIHVAKASASRDGGAVKVFNLFTDHFLPLALGHSTTHLSAADSLKPRHGQSNQTTKPRP